MGGKWLATIEWCSTIFLVAFCLSGSGCTAKSTAAPSASSGTPPAANSCASGVTSATINIFTENPITDSGNAALAYTATLDTTMTTSVTLSGLTGNCILESSRYKISSDSIYPSNVQGVTSSSLARSPTSPEFQQLNSFYYATQLRNLVVDTLGGTLSTQISIDAHCNQANNAFFSPSSKRLCFGYVNAGGGKRVWAADDADVVVHEAGHAVNHALASTDIMGSTPEASAIDESLGDYWAITVLNDPELSEWFLGALGSGMRDATANHTYPTDMVLEEHDDSRVLTEVLWDLRKGANLGSGDTDKMVKRALQTLPATTTFADFYQAFYDASATVGLSVAEKALIVTKFTAKGIHRVDSATGLRLSTVGGATQVYVIDDHTFFDAGGNCNGVLDVGEYALVMVNLENVNAGAMGMGTATLGALPAGVVAATGGDKGYFFRINGSTDFVTSLPATASYRKSAALWASFLIGGTTAGAKNLSLTFSPMHADPTGAVPANPDVTVNFTLTVGSTATSTSCTNAALWP